MIDLPKRGRPKKQAPSSISIPVPQVEEFQAGLENTSNTITARR